MRLHDASSQHTVDLWRDDLPRIEPSIQIQFYPRRVWPRRAAVAAGTGACTDLHTSSISYDGTANQARAHFRALSVPSDMGILS